MQKEGGRSFATLKTFVQVLKVEGLFGRTVGWVSLDRDEDISYFTRARSFKNQVAPIPTSETVPNYVYLAVLGRVKEEKCTLGLLLTPTCQERKRAYQRLGFGQLLEEEFELSEKQFEERGELPLRRRVDTFAILPSCPERIPES